VIQQKADVDGDGNISWEEFVRARKLGEEVAEIETGEAPGKIVGDILVYIIFMCIITLLTTRDLSNPNIFHLGNNIQGQLTGVEMKAEHSPTWGKAFGDVATVEEAYHWMLGPFIHSAFRPNTFDGDSDWGFSASGKPEGKTLGYGKIMGGIRISQVRSKEFDCNEYVSPKLTQGGDYNFTCYGSTEWGHMGDFSIATEDTEPFSDFRYGGATAASTGNAAVPSLTNADGSPRTRGPFKWEGITATGQPLEETVDELRAKYLSSFTSKYFHYYPSPAFAVTLSPMLGYENATAVVEDLIRATYIDLHTRAVFVDLSVYNAHLDRVVFCRLIFELTSAGGVIPSEYFRTIRLWRMVTTEDAYYSLLTVVVSVFYAYNVYSLYRTFKTKGWGVFKEFLYITEALNFIFWFAAMGCGMHAESLFPLNMDLEGEQYIDMLPSVQFKVMATYVSAINVFLNWLKMIKVSGLQVQLLM
jgi:hypothetical protein